MSITNILKAMRSGLTPSERFVWQCLENRANGAGFWRMTDKAIAAELDIAVKSVQRAIAALVRKGIITAERHKRRPTVFHVTRANSQSHADLSGQTDHPNPELSGQNVHTARAGFLKKEKKERYPPERKKDISIKPRSRLDAATAPPGFDGFWQNYPRKVGKRAAMKAFTLALKRAPAAEILAGLARAQWSDDPQYIPHATTWLNGDRWTDEPDPPKQTLREQWNLGSFLTPHFDDETAADYDATFTTPKPKGFLQ